MVAPPQASLIPATNNACLTRSDPFLETFPPPPPLARRQHQLFVLRNSPLPCLRLSSSRSRFNPSARVARQSHEGEAILEISLLVDRASELQDAADASTTDVKDRVHLFHDRVRLLKESAEQALKDGGCIPAQVVATFSALQREHSSLEDSVRLALDVGPTLPDGEPPHQRDCETEKGQDNSIRFNETEKTLSVAVKDEKSNSLLSQTTERESPENQLKYVMTTPSSQGSSPLANFKAEVERRVMDQLAGKQVRTSIKAITDDQSEAENKRKQIEMLKVACNTGQLMQDSLKETTRKIVARELNSGLVAEGEENVTNQSRHMDGPVFRIMEAERKARLAEAQSALKSLELDRLRIQFGWKQSVIRNVELATARADAAEAQLQKLEMEVAKNIPADIHEQAIKRVRESLLEARRRVSQITGEVREREEMLSAMKLELEDEQKQLLKKVRELTSELSTRVTLEDMEIAINSAVAATKEELVKSQEKVLTLSFEVEKKDRFFGRLREEWIIEKKGLQLELETLKGRLASMQSERIHDKAQLSESQKKVNILEEELLHLTQGINDAEAHRDSQRQAMLHNIRILVREMMKVTCAKAASDAKPNNVFQVMTLLEDDEELRTKTEGNVIGTMPSSVNVDEISNFEGALLSGERTTRLQQFFSFMGQLIRQESEQMNADFANIQQQTDNMSK